MFIEVPDEASLSEEAVEWYRRQLDSWGYMPNYAHAFATRPDIAEAWNQLNKAVGSNMERRRYELATIAAARVYRSTYCTAAHSKFLRDNCGEEGTMRAFADDPSGDSLDEVDRAVVAFATQVAKDAASVTGGDVQRLRDQGLTDADVVSIAAAAAARAFFTKFLDALGVEPDAELAETLGADLVDKVTVGRPIAGSVQVEAPPAASPAV